MWLGFPVVMAVEPWVCGAGRELFMAVEEHWLAYSVQLVEQNGCSFSALTVARR